MTNPVVYALQEVRRLFGENYHSAQIHAPNHLHFYLRGMPVTMDVVWHEDCQLWGVRCDKRQQQFGAVLDSLLRSVVQDLYRQRQSDIRVLEAYQANLRVLLETINGD